MAVENKFKLNVIAASVLMGLSLSAVAADGAANTAQPAAESKPAGGQVTVPAKPETLAEVVGTVEPGDISVTVASASTKLDAALKAAVGSEGSAQKSYTDAVTDYGKLKPEELQKATDLTSKDSAFKATEANFKAFDVKSKAVKDVYDSKLQNLYGSTDQTANHAWTIVEGDNSAGSSATITLNAAKDTVFNGLVSSIKTTKDAVVALEVQAIASAGGTDASEEAKKADAAVKAYATYLDASYKVLQEQQKQAAAENYIQEKLPGFLTLVEKYKKADGNTDADKSTNAGKLDGKYQSYIQAVKDYRDASDNDKPGKKTAVYTALNALVTAAGTATIDEGDKTAVAAFTKSLGAAHTIWDAVSQQLGTKGKLQAALDKAKDLTSGKDGLPADISLTIADNQAAFNGIDKYIKELIAVAEAKGTDKDKLTAAIATAKEASKAFTEKQEKYTAALAELNAASAERIALVPEWQSLNQAYTEAADAYNAAKTAYATSDVKSRTDTLNTTKAAYIKSLADTSAGIGSAISGAVKTYTDAVKKDGTATTQQEKNAALYTLIGQKKVLIPAKLQMDKDLLELKAGDLAGLQSELSSAEKVRDDAAKAWNTAVQEYLAAKETFGKTNAVTDEVAVSVAEHKLLSISGMSDLSGLYKAGSEKGGFKTFDELKTSAPAWLSLKAASDKLFTNSDIQTSRKNVAEGLHSLASLMPLSTADEQKALRQNYLDALKTISTPATDADAQSKVANAESITHYLGGLSTDEITQYDPASGNYKSIIVNVDDKGNVTGVKDNFTGKDLYTGTQDKPFTTTVLDIGAPELGNGALADTNTITVGEAGTKDKKATPVEVWAKTADSAGTPAVKLSGDLRTATAQLDENGKPVDGQIVRGADQIHLQNVNIHNSFTLADKVKMLADDVAALNQQAADKIALGQPGDAVNKWLKGENDLLLHKYDELVLTGLNINTTTVNPSFNLETGEWLNKNATKAPGDANILLDNLNITLQNDSVGGTSTVIDLSGTGNHILANGGVFDAGHVTGPDSEKYVLDISSEYNTVDFTGSTLKGDIYSGATGNTVNLKNGTLTGNAIAGTGNLTLNLDGSTWTGGAGPHSPDVSLSNNSVWNVKGYYTVGYDDFPASSVNSLTLNGSNTLNLVNAEGQAQLGGRGFVGSKYGTVLSVDHDLVSDGKGVTSVLAGTYSPGNAHRLTDIGLANDGYGGYRFGAINVDGLATGGKYALSVESSGAEPYTIGGRLADGADAVKAHEFVSYKTSESRPDDTNPSALKLKSSTADFTSLSAPAELGVYQYAAEKVMDGVSNRTSIYYSSTGKLSNSAATVVSLAAAPVDVANLESDTLAKHMNSVRHGKDSGVWVSYFGGENRNSTAAGPEYTLKTNGVMLGVDTLTENDWLAGVAVSSARSDMSVMNSSGDLNSYGAQFYMSRRYDSGVFVDSALQFNHFSNTAKARMTDGQQAKADFSGNSYGLEAKVGYAWNSEGFFAEPYVRAAARAFDGEHYALSNGMTVNSNDYKSMLGEIGADLGYQYDISGGYVKPYLHLAALNEFADGNSVRVNNVSLDNSVKGAAFQAGLGAEVKVTDNLGGYAAFDYTKGDNTERPWQATVGVNYTW
ncbi:TPA: autotransporter outer membrane beta-barrel domain-containing protein [Salmonella enterica]|uniref:Autotransporter outer membrane beta-barrel domain-containing protein n=2 Tax=Salmonella enterica TaxID=28901 RepID=A0A743TVR1_SALER|nr:autotransporter outer membrane beta-barrel domain-containing protein [Salmonella enterica]HAF2207056.1 autotransporter outer membrane beta-barrel domain-containing protein [Salmonella enterica]HAF2376411.1 autotransporter outer membrane beta-barrel domain-containing protein [Salmonella enterica]HAF2572249.1 autotransporter outer membrane beta-barrel domain-containing protein [Salmonella enterica]HAG4669008.1 autotransporter outer membrane beta-barrel domain-containing protein [Salmonella ent